MDFTRRVIRKQRGGERVIHVPSDDIRDLCRRLKPVVDNFPIAPCVYGISQEKDIRNCVLQHVGNDFMIKMDIKDFFPSISRWDYNRQALGIPYSTMQDLYRASGMLSGQLKQGSPIAPAMANLRMVDFDRMIMRYCEYQGVTYTRYFDDMQVSSNDAQAVHNAYRHIRQVLPMNLNLNMDKTVVYDKDDHKQMLGIKMTDQGLRASNKHKRTVLHNMVAKAHNGQLTNHHFKQALGILAWCEYVEGDNPSNKTIRMKEVIWNTLKSRIVT